MSDLTRPHRTYSLAEIGTIAANIVETTGQPATPEAVRAAMSEDGDWLLRAIAAKGLRSLDDEKIGVLKAEIEQVKVHVRAYAIGIECFLAGIVLLQIVILAKIFL